MGIQCCYNNTLRDMSDLVPELVRKAKVRPVYACARPNHYQANFLTQLFPQVKKNARKGNPTSVSSDNCSWKVRVFKILLLMCYWKMLMMKQETNFTSWRGLRFYLFFNIGNFHLIFQNQFFDDLYSISVCPLCCQLLITEYQNCLFSLPRIMIVCVCFIQSCVHQVAANMISFFNTWP